MVLWREHPETQEAINEADVLHAELLATVARLQLFIDDLVEAESLTIPLEEDRRDR